MTVFSTSINLSASREQAWRILAEMEKWPEWTESMSSVRAVGTGPIGLGSKFAVKQPQLPLAEMTVIEWQPGHSFTWRSEGQFVWAVAEHVLTPAGHGCTLTLSLKFGGLLAPMVTLLSGKLVRRYVRMEAEGLQAECLRQLDTAAGCGVKASSAL